MTTSFTFFLSSNNTTPIESASLLSSDNDFEAQNTCSILTFDNPENATGMDAFGGKDLFGNPDFSNMDSSFMANNAGAETVGSVAMNSAETVGSVACADFGASASIGGDCGGFSGGDCGGASGGFIG